MDDVEQVKNVLQKFQEGYSRRDLDSIDEFMELFVPDDELEVIGTGAAVPGGGEWCLGPETTRKLVYSDWKSWGDLLLDLDVARVHVMGDVAWMATSGSINDRIDTLENYKSFLEYTQEVVDRQDMSEEAKMLELLRGGANTLFETRRGELYTWPFRFTAVLVRRDGQWRFHQMQFSFPTTRFPDVRVA